MKTFLALLVAGLALVFTACSHTVPKDYTAFRNSQPRSLLVLPPVNQSTEVIAGYSFLTTVTRPLAELGYYVVPVGLVDRYMKENGMPGADEMHRVPIAKLHEVFGADAVLYITVEKYGTKYIVIASENTVHASAVLLDAKTGTVLWENKVTLQASGNAGLVEALVEQVVNKLTDSCHTTAAMASSLLLAHPQTGLLRGPRHPEFGKSSP